MQNNEHHIDKAFRKLSGLEVKPPEHVWERIDKSLDRNKKRRIGAWAIGLSSAASIAIAFIFGWQFASNQIDNKIAGLPQKIEHAATNTFETQTDPTDKQTFVAEPIEVVAEKSLIAKYVEKLATTKTNVQNVLAQNNNEHTKDLLHAALTKMPSINGAAFSNPNVYGLMKIDKYEGSSFLSDTDRAIIESNLLAMNSVKKDDKEINDDGNWSVGLQASPVYMYDQPNGGSLLSNKDYAVMQNSVSANYKTNISGGFKVAYSASKKIIVQSGINYNEISMDGGNIGVSLGTNNWEVSGEKMLSNNSIGSLINNDMITGSDQAFVATSSGIANLNMERGATLASLDMADSFEKAPTANYEYTQRAQYVEVPLLLRYNLIDEKIGLHVLGGVNTNLLVSNHVMLENNNDIIAKGKIDDLSPITFSGSFGFGINYGITQKLQLMVEPTIKTQLNSINSNAIYNVKPLSFGVFSGVSYKF